MADGVLAADRLSCEWTPHPILIMMGTMNARPPRRLGAAFGRGILLAVAGAAAAGCSHNYAYLPLDPARHDAVMADLAVAGVLDRRGDAAFTAKETTARLVDAAGTEDISAPFSPTALALLMAPPSELLINAEKLAKIRGIVGHRYLLVGQQGTAAIDRSFYWCPLVLLPFPYVTLGSRTKEAAAEEYDVAQAAQILRVIDLEESAVIAEFHMVLGEPPDDAPAWSGSIRSALAAMALR